MNGFYRMCEHSEILADGEYVCQNCGLVLEKEFIYNKSFSPALEKTSNFVIDRKIENIIDILHLNAAVSKDEVQIYLKKYLSEYNYDIELKICGAIYHILSLVGTSFPLSYIENLVCSSSRQKKVLYKIIQLFDQNFLTHNDEFKLLYSFLSKLNFKTEDVELVRNRLENYDCKFCSYSSVTRIAGHTYVVVKNTKQNLSLKDICKSLSISKNSVYLFLNERHHSCVKNWK